MDKYLLGEIKFKKPPYRLYVVADQENEKYYVVRWEHKKRQQKVIDELKNRFEYAFKIGIKNVMELFAR